MLLELGKEFGNVSSNLTRRRLGVALTYPKAEFIEVSRLGWEEFPDERAHFVQAEIDLVGRQQKNRPVLHGTIDYVRVRLEKLHGELYATPLPSKSGAIFTLVKADGMVRIDLNQEGLETRDEVEVLLF